MKVYEVKVRWSDIGNQEWLIQADTIDKAVYQAQNKITRAPRRYEDYEVVRVTLIGDLVN